MTMQPIETRTAEWLDLVRRLAGLQQDAYSIRLEDADIDAGIRAARQRQFLLEEGRVMGATVAFGMGVDKPDVRVVIHADHPMTVQAYW